MPLPLYFNGKFYSGGLNGVHRVADRLIRECDDLLAAMPEKDRPKAYLLTAKDATWVPKLRVIERRDFRKTNQLWEQFVLPRAASDGVLINLANLAPIAHNRKLTMLHDAQFLRPDCGYPARQRLGYRLLAPRMAKSSRSTLTVSEYSRSVLANAGIADRAKVQVIPNGADHILDAPESHELRDQLALEPGSYVVLFGSTKGYKNAKVLFDAFQSRRLGGTRLVVIGPDREEFAAAGLTAPSSTVFAGRPGDGDLRGLLAGALALAFPSRTEGFGLPPLEAMLCGCPVIASAAGAIPEACGEAAIYAGVDAPGAWIEAILSLARSPALRAHRTAAGYERASSFTWEQAGRKLMAAVTAVAKEP